MAIINDSGQKISYKCSDLINEVWHDIIEFGTDQTVNAIAKDIHGVRIYTDYMFPEDDITLDNDEVVEPMPISDFLKKLQEQNRIL